MTPEQIEALKAKHPGSQLHELTSESGVVIVVKAPDRATFKRFRAQVQDERRKLDAPEVLLRACIVHPELGVFDALLDKQPGLIETFAGEVLTIAGAERGVEKKAL